MNFISKEEKILLISEEVSKFYKMPLESICSKSRDTNTIIPRQVAQVLCYEIIPNARKTDIGRLIGGVDHATVINSIKSINNQLYTDKLFQEEFKELKINISRSFYINRLGDVNRRFEASRALQRKFSASKRHNISY